jgi:superfamily II DNA helicase RecQ
MEVSKQFTVIFLGERADEVKRKDLKIIAKLPKTKMPKKEVVQQKTVAEITKINYGLFAKLRRLRTDIAKQKKVPPNVVFFR